MVVALVLVEVFSFVFVLVLLVASLPDVEVSLLGFEGLACSWEREAGFPGSLLRVVDAD